MKTLKSKFTKITLCLLLALALFIPGHQKYQSARADVFSGGLLLLESFGYVGSAVVLMGIAGTFWVLLTEDKVDEKIRVRTVKAPYRMDAFQGLIGYQKDLDRLKLSREMATELMLKDETYSIFREQIGQLISEEVNLSTEDFEAASVFQNVSLHEIFSRPLEYGVIGDIKSHLRSHKDILEKYPQLLPAFITYYVGRLYRTLSGQPFEGTITHGSSPIPVTEKSMDKNASYSLREYLFRLSDSHRDIFLHHASKFFLANTSDLASDKALAIDPKSYERLVTSVLYPGEFERLAKQYDGTELADISCALNLRLPLAN